MAYKYQDSQVPVEERISDLLSRMTLEEKFVQLSSTWNFDEIVSMTEEDKFPEHGISAVLLRGDVKPEVIDRVQRFQMERTRLSIPFLLTSESLHGLTIEGATVFPQAIGLGATFDPTLMGDIADVIGLEAEGIGVRQTYAPDLDIARDPRWGRVEETFGEDPYLTGKMGTAYVKAFQKHHAASTCKHFLAHGSPEGGVNTAPSHMGEREVREVMLPPFVEVIQDGGCLALMPAYSELDGIPMHCSHFWLRKVLRNELGFDGCVTSDAGGVLLLNQTHHVADSPRSAGERSLRAGVNQELGNYGYCRELMEAVRTGEVPAELVDEAVACVLRMKFRVGLFDQPYSNAEARSRMHSPEAVALSRRAALESVVLLQNNGVLPLKPSISCVAVVGPGADAARLGDYTVCNANLRSVTLRQALEKRLGRERVRYAAGCQLTEPGDLQAAVQAAEDADAVIVVLCDNSDFLPPLERGENYPDEPLTCGENYDTNTLLLPDPQRALLKAVRAVGKPVILILETGRPYCIREECALSEAVMEAWYPGEAGGEALCALLFGDENPCGKLPITFPKTVGHLPCYYNFKRSARLIDGVPDDVENPAALFPFGYGLSYTQFAYRDLIVKGEQVSVTVENIGDRFGKETVLMFLTQKTCPVTPCIKQLCGMKKIGLAPGECQTVTFQLTDAECWFIDEDMQKVPAKGSFTVRIGDLSTDFTR